MSNISNISTQNIIASFAGTQRSDQAKERTVAENKQSQNHQDTLQIGLQKIEDVADLNSSGDRDANGLYLPDEQHKSDEENQEDNKTADQEKFQNHPMLLDHSMKILG